MQKSKEINCFFLQKVTENLRVSKKYFTFAMSKNNKVYMKTNELLKILREAGCEPKRQAKGSHQIWWNPETGKQCAVPIHPSKEVGTGLVKKNYKRTIRRITYKIINMKYIFIVEKTNTGYSAYAENANVATVGDTYAELKENMLEALNMLLEEEQKPLAKESDIEIKFDLAQFLEYYNGINILSLSQKIGVSNSLISQYKTRKKYPSEKQAQKIFQGIKSYGMELASIDLV